LERVHDQDSAGCVNLEKYGRRNYGRGFRENKGI